VESGDAATAEAWAKAGWITRVWSYTEDDIATFIPAFPSTDTPLDDWYLSLCEEEDVLE
jgi:hypothetical protein